VFLETELPTMPTSSHISYVAALSAASVAIATLLPIALYQCHAIDHLPDPPCTYFDSDRITGSKSAHPFGIPDSLLGLASYGITTGLIFAARRSETGRTLLRTKLLVDGSMAAINVTRQVVSFRKLCSWCTGTALATAVLVVAGRDMQ
jgi:Vitamin K epoxide reductase family.